MHTVIVRSPLWPWAKAPAWSSLEGRFDPWRNLGVALRPDTAQRGIRAPCRISPLLTRRIQHGDLAAPVVVSRAKSHACEEVRLRQFHVRPWWHGRHVRAASFDPGLLCEIPDGSSPESFLAKWLSACTTQLIACRISVTQEHSPGTNRSGQTSLVEDGPRGGRAAKLVSFACTFNMNEQGHGSYFASHIVGPVDTVGLTQQMHLP